MTTPLGYSKTPTPVPGPARAIRRRRAMADGCARFIIVPHVLVGAGLVLGLVFMLAWAGCGTNYPGTVTGIGIGKTRHGTPTYQLQYSYTVDGVVIKDRENIDENHYREKYENFDKLTSEQKEVMVRHFEVLGLRRAGVAGYSGGWGLIGFLAVFATVWNAITWGVGYSLWITPFIQKRVYRHGEATTGKVTDKRVVARGKRTSYEVSYVFKDPATGQDIQGRTETDGKGYASYGVGDEVTVLYDPWKPGRNVAYELGGWEAA